MHDVNVAQQRVGADDVARLLRDTPVANSQCMREHPAAWYRAGGIASRDEHDLDSGCDEAPGEDVDDVFGAAVCDGWDGQPRWCDDAHAKGTLVEAACGPEIEALGHDLHGDKQVDQFQGS